MRDEFINTIPLFSITATYYFLREHYMLHHDKTIGLIQSYSYFLYYKVVGLINSVVEYTFSVLCTVTVNVAARYILIETYII